MLFPELSYARPHDPLLRRVVIRSVEQAVGRRKLARLYAEWRETARREPQTRFRTMLELMRIRLDIAGSFPPDLAPGEPLVIVANHPFGIGDGAALLALAETLGRPFRILVSNDLMRIEEMAECGLPISFEETREAQKLTLNTRREAMRLLAEGVAIIVFPAGGVATAGTLFGRAEDLPWKAFAAKLARRGGATVLPVHVDGQNGPLFHLVSPYSQTLRYGLLLGAFRRLYGRTIRLTIGAPIRRLDAADGRALTDLLRRSVFEMAPGAATRRDAPRAALQALSRRARVAEIRPRRSRRCP